MLVVTRYTVDPGEAHAFLERATAALRALAARPGYRSGRVGRATDEPALWVLSTDWDGVGSYRRALSAYDVRVSAVPLLSLARDEPTAFEVLVEVGDGAGREEVRREPLGRAADAGTVGLGEASAPVVPTDLN